MYGRPSIRLQPLMDVQRFLRHGYAHERCLLGITLSYRTPHDAMYNERAPTLEVEDVNDFVAAEAAQQVGITSTC